ncbi:nucleotidyltransferase domain-containing protein [Nonomuraea longicatena]|uniref:Amino acid transporter n=1 Tax=Nonomuraea longicatena TaxID=83682 RepID=A0ABP4B8K6_9ACTN
MTWEHAPLPEIIALFRPLKALWWLSGGYALERAVGHAYRDHGDLDLSVRRDDHLAARAHLAGWDCHVADPPGELRPWAVGEVLPAHAHDIWVREHPGGPWRFQLMLDEIEGDEWVYRRDPAVRRPLSSLLVADDGFLRLSPEVQLLFKSVGIRPKDEVDFERVVPILTEAQLDWLVSALPSGHVWRQRLLSE